ncbi:MAG: hypothetical protein ABIZ91_14860 [Gemmatimonadaceae bacterium]
MTKIFSSRISWLFLAGATAHVVDQGGTPGLAVTSDADAPQDGNTVHWQLQDLFMLTGAGVILGFHGSTDARRVGLSLFQTTRGKADGDGFFKYLGGKVDDPEAILHAWLRSGADFGRRADGWSDFGFRGFFQGSEWKADRNGRPVKGRSP